MMIDIIVKEIRMCLDAELYTAALTLALTLPDACGKVAYPELGNKARYTKWVSEMIDEYDRPPEYLGDENEIRNEHPYFSAKEMYGLRCNLLHESVPKGEVPGVNSFVLFANKEVVGSRSQIYTDLLTGDKVVTQHLNVVSLCKKLCRNAEVFYEENKTQFGNDEYAIKDSMF